MQTKHTRAPWRVRNDFGNLKIIQPEMDIELARMVVCDEDFDEAEANARLMAAAPELYKELEKCAKLLREYEQYHLKKYNFNSEKAKRNADYAESAERILAKARGENEQN